MSASTFEKNNLPELGVTELWLVVFHASTSLSPFRTSTTPFTTQRFLLASLVPSHPLCEEDLNQGKPKQCTMDPPLPPMIQLWREGNMGEEGNEREREVERTVDVQAFSLRKEGWCMLIVFFPFLQPECKIVWQKPGRWTELARSRPRRNVLL